jgi:hypothetical protein
VPKHHHHVSSSAINAFIDRPRVVKLLEPWIPEERDRTFVARCLLDEGPAHHRGANYVLLALLQLLVERGGPVAPRGDRGNEIPLRLPPHLLEKNPQGRFPVRCPTRALELLAPATDPAHAAMVDCVTDGPPQHALANVAMLGLLEVLLERAGALGC